MKFEIVEIVLVRWMSVWYSTLLCFWPVEELAELVDRPVGVCGEVVRVGCLFAWNFSLTMSALLLGVETRTR